MPEIVKEFVLRKFRGAPVKKKHPVGRKICVKVVFFSEKKSLLKVFFQVQKWSSFVLIFMKLGLPEKLGTLD